MSLRLEPSTINTRFTNVRSAFRVAERDPVIAHDPTNRVHLPRQHKREQRIHIPTPEEVGRAALPAGAARERAAAVPAQLS
jgi:site-specific recombinase XerD